MRRNRATRCSAAKRAAATRRRRRGSPTVRIAFDHQTFAIQEYGGVSRYCVRLAGELAAAGNDVRVVAPLYINRYLDELPRANVVGRRIASSRWGNRAMRRLDQLAARPLLARLAPDIVHETYFAPRRSAPRRARTVLTVYDMIHEKFPESFPPSDATAALKAAAVARADHVLCISENTRRDLIAIHPAAAAKSSVTLLGFDVPPTVDIHTTGRPYLLFVGNRDSYKNFASLLAAYAASPALRGGFDLLAVGGGRFTADEEAQIATARLGERVRWQSADEDALRRLYAGAAVFIYPSLYEGFGIPPLEAMAAGTPVVAVAAGSVPEICGDAVAYAEPGSIDSLRDAIERVVASPSLAAKLIAAGHRRLTVFSWGRCAAETAAVYRSLL